MKYDFDRAPDRRRTASLKWDFCEQVLGAADIIPMWVADMDFPAPPPVVEAVRKRAEHPVFGYPLAPRSYWTSIMNWMKTRHGWEIKREWLSQSPGVVPALSLCILAFSSPGDKIVIQTPVYRPFFSSVENNGRRIVRNSLKYENGRFVMDLEGLESKIDGRTRMLILCSPHNPVGRVWTRDELERLGKICVSRDLLVVSDEIHSDLVFKGHRHFPFASISEELASRAVTLMAPSKTFNIAGLSTSVVIAPNPKLMGRYEAQLRNIGLGSGNVFGIVALEAAYAHGGEWLDDLLAYLEGNADYAAEFIARRIPGIRFIRPEGTFLALLDCRGLGLEQKALNEFFLGKAKVYFDDGTIFGRELLGFERMNLACPRALLRRALENMETAVNETRFSL